MNSLFGSLISLITAPYRAVKAVGKAVGELINPALPEPDLPPLPIALMAKRRKRVGTGRRSTLLTGPAGVTDAPVAPRKSLLGL